MAVVIKKICLRVLPHCCEVIQKEGRDSWRKSFVGKRPQRASVSKAKSSDLSELSGLEKVLFNDFIDDELDSEDVSA